MNNTNVLNNFNFINKTAKPKSTTKRGRLFNKHEKNVNTIPLALPK